MKIRSSYITSFLLCLTCYLGIAVASHAAVLKFDPTSTTTSTDGTFDVDVVVDAGSDEISGTDAYIQYDNNIVEAQNVTKGTFFFQQLTVVSRQIRSILTVSFNKQQILKQVPESWRQLPLK